MEELIFYVDKFVIIKGEIIMLLIRILCIGVFLKRMYSNEEKVFYYIYWNKKKMIIGRF